MIRFNNDYSEGAHPRILEALGAINFSQNAGYGEDEHCRAAAERIRALAGQPDAAVHFLVGGTQANATVIDAALRPHQGVLCAETGHIHGHETGAVEATGHKVLALPARAGKITAEQVEEYCRAHWADASFEHYVQPKMVYLSLPTELGTLYTKAELEAMRDVCDRRGLYLFVDGARLGYGLASPACDITLPQLAALCDVFYLGGTKQGALFGEAVVLRNDALKADFRYLIKQHGGMLAKGWLLGVQFEELLRDDLYFRLAGHADSLAERLRTALGQMGVPFYVDSPTNQLFPILPDGVLEALARDYTFTETARVDEGRRAVRLCTSWATRPEHVEALIASVQALLT